MADAAITTLCEALVTSLDATFSGQFEAVRTYFPDLTREQVQAGLQVLVAGAAATDGAISRHGSQEDLTVHVALLQAVDAANNATADIDALIYLVEQIRDAVRLQTFGNCGWIATSNEPIYDPDRLKSEGIFISVLAFTFRTFR